MSEQEVFTNTEVELRSYLRERLKLLVVKLLDLLLLP